MKKYNFKKSFFASYDEEIIFTLWNESNILIDLANKLGLSQDQKLICLNYGFIDKIKTIKNWKK